MSLEETQAYVADKMDEILSCFKPGRKITVLVRTPDEPTQDFLMTSDDPDQVIAALERRKQAGADTQ